MTTANKWSELTIIPEIQAVIKDQFKFTNLMPVQKAAIPLFLQNFDVAVEAQTGSGKTLTFLVPIFNQMIKMKKSDKLFAMIISPSRELAQQIYEVALKFNIGKVQLCIGGSNRDDTRILNDEGCSLLIGTPGRLKQILDDNNLKLVLKDLEYLVFDEADRLLSEEYTIDLQVILSKLPKQRRTGLFSATLSSVKMHDLQKLGLRNPVQIKADVEATMPSGLKNSYILCNDRMDKTAVLLDLINGTCKDTKVMIFFNTCASVEYYNQILGFKNMSCMHGRMKQKKRIKIFNNFKTSDNSAVLLTTDVLARGIDFEDVPLVIQFDPPQDPSFFVHRSGRTARSGRSGESILLIENSEQPFIKFLQKSNINMQPKDVQRTIPFESIKERVLELVQQDRDLIEKGKMAFISFVRSYKEHKLQLLFRFDQLNIGHVAQSFFLLRIPRIKEILGKKIDFQQIDINPNQVEFQDKNKEKQFLQKKEMKQQKIQEKQEQLQQLKTIQFHKKYMGKEVNVKNNKSLRKKIKTQHDEEEEDDMIHEQRLARRFKQGKISLQQYRELVKELDPEELVDAEYDDRVI